jgi:hypothetical protein
MTTETPQQEDFAELNQRFMRDVVKFYDEHNKGPYFEYDFKANEKEGITYERDGKRIYNLGKEIITQGFRCYLPNFQAVKSDLEKDNTNIRNYWMRENTRRRFIWPLDSLIRDLHEQEVMSLHRIRENFDKIVDITQIQDERVPYVYKDALGKMIFHLVRVHPASGIHDISPEWTCRVLHEIRKKMHSRFWEETKMNEQEFGEALVKELLERDLDFERTDYPNGVPAYEAREALSSYDVTDPKIIKAVHDAIKIETKQFVNMSLLKSKKKAHERKYKKERRTYQHS